jgi:hypothetical protein
MGMTLALVGGIAGWALFSFARRAFRGPL